MIWFIYFCIYDSEIASQFIELAELSAVFFHLDLIPSLDDCLITVGHLLIMSCQDDAQSVADPYPLH